MNSQRDPGFYWVIHKNGWEGIAQWRKSKISGWCEWLFPGMFESQTDMEILEIDERRIIRPDEAIVIAPDLHTNPKGVSDDR